MEFRNQVGIQQNPNLNPRYDAKSREKSHNPKFAQNTSNIPIFQGKIIIFRFFSATEICDFFHEILPRTKKIYADGSVKLKCVLSQEDKEREDGTFHYKEMKVPYTNLVQVFLDPPITFLIFHHFCYSSNFFFRFFQVQQKQI